MSAAPSSGSEAADGGNPGFEPAGANTIENAIASFFRRISSKFVMYVESSSALS